jgi:protein-disulfide isomerase
MSKKNVVLAGLILLLLLGAGAVYYYWNDAGNDAVAPADAASSLPPDTVGANEHVMGKANAPVTMIEYFAQGCSVCANFNQTVFPQLKAKYIDTGKVRYVMRLYPLFPVDGPSYKLDMCVPPDHFFQSVDLLFRNQPQWDDAEYPVLDSHGGLIRMARIMGLTAEQADACMKSTKYDAGINKVSQDATTRYQPDGTPTFVIDFKKADLPDKSWASMQAAIDAALAAKGVK